eukprot:comp19824_c1_seq1/m.23846 comp19824_c1_seq1/g.23846  ORF comp19824_c1_seq1/g.23846 comp19824_c1_seq1/m.23846 type:complete len:348 (-) comp19824_c1_seq1:472-1515(-)
MGIVKCMSLLLCVACMTASAIAASDGDEQLRDGVKENGNKIDSKEILQDAEKHTTSHTPASNQEVSGLQAQINELKAEVTTLKDTVLQLNASLTDLRHSLASQPAQTQREEGIPSRLDASATRVGPSGFSRFYKIKQKPWERTLLDLSVSFEVYAGDTYLGDFWQSNPVYRLFWDEMCFYDDKERYRGQLWVGFWKYYLGVFPNPFYGVNCVYLRDAEGKMTIKGCEETVWKALGHADRRSLDFENDKGIHMKSRKTNENKGVRRWEIVKSEGGDKVAEMAESYVHDVLNRKVLGWNVEVLDTELLDPRIPGYMTAFDLAEEQDYIPAYLYTIFFGILFFFLLKVNV